MRLVRWASGCEDAGVLRRVFVLVVVITAGAPSAFATVARSSTLAVPRVVGMDLNSAYLRLYGAGLSVSDTSAFSASSGGCLPVVIRQAPSAGARASNGASVVLTARRPACGVSSPGVPTGRIPSARVPDFAGRPLSFAVAWAEQHRLDWDAGRLPRLRDANATKLLGNYRILGQSPHPGAILRLGVGTGSGSAGTFLPTPLRLYCAAR